MVKLLVLYKRRAGMAVEDFHKDLQAQTQRPGGLAGLRRYLQFHTLAQGYKRGELIFDAVAEYDFDTLEQAQAARSALRQQRDALKLVDPAQCMDMLVDNHLVKATPVPANAIKNIEFVNRKSGMPLDAFFAYWRNTHGPIGAAIPSVLRYEQNHLNRSEYAGSQPPRFDGVATTWFASTNAMRGGADTPEYAATRADEPNFIPPGHLPVVIGREVIDWSL